MSEDNQKQSQNKGGVGKWILGIFGILGSLLFLFILFGVISSISEDSGSPNRPRLSVGEQGILNDNLNISDCEGKVPVALSEEALEDLTSAEVANDQYGWEEVFRQNRAIFVDNCTQVQVIDYGGFGVSKIRLSDRPEVTGWIPYEYAVASTTEQ